VLKFWQTFVRVPQEKLRDFQENYRGSCRRDFLIRDIFSYHPIFVFYFVVLDIRLFISFINFEY
jgi:hypothetical protein